MFPSNFSLSSPYQSQQNILKRGREIHNDDNISNELEYIEKLERLEYDPKRRIFSNCIEEDDLYLINRQTPHSINNIFENNSPFDVNNEIVIEDNFNINNVPHCEIM
jgi:hypothetical protein